MGVQKKGSLDTFVKEESKIQSEAKQQEILNTFVEEIGGSDALQIIEILSSSNEEITDEELSTETDLRLNIVRKILYKLYDNQLASYRRTRDQNTGWFVYYWKLIPNRVKELLLKRKKQVLKVLEDRLAYEQTNMFFECSTSTCSRLIFTQAVENSFRCPTCGKVLNHQQNEIIITVLEKKLKDLKRSIENGTS
ncbi:MAG: transcription factor [Candidatus Lokiarchaeota archaeon]|nr:transcription factor [Candidatus Lokiarchaeota archaeon]